MSLIFMIWHLNCYSFTKSHCIAYILKTLKLCILFGPETFIQKNYERVQNFSYKGVYYIWKHGKILNNTGLKSDNWCIHRVLHSYEKDRLCGTRRLENRINSMILFLKIYVPAHRHPCMVKLSWVLRCERSLVSFCVPVFF